MSDAQPPGSKAWAHRRWLLDYADAEGAPTRRFVLITSVKPLRRQVVGHCELRGAERTFSAFGIVSFTDPETGELFDAESWFALYRSGSRKPQGPVDRSAQAVGRRRARAALSGLFGR